MPVEERDIRLLLPDRAGTSVVVDSDGRLPSIRVTLADGATTAGTVVREILPGLGLSVPIIDCFVDQSGSDDGPTVALVEVEPPQSAWQPPEGWQWAELADVDDTIAPALQDHLTQLLEERRGRRPVPELRPLWCRHGWYERVCRWVGEQLAASGRAQPTRIEPLRQWGISAVMRVELPEARCWFKAVFPHFRAEPTITAFLDRELPGSVAPVIAIESGDGWLLLDDVGSDVAAAHAELHHDAIARLVTLQRVFTDRTDELEAAGLPRRSIRELPHVLAEALSAPAVQATLAVEPGRADHVVAWLRDAVARIDALGYPETLVHGDFHPGNVAVARGTPIVFDWSDAAISHPLIDVVTWTWWYEDDAERVDGIWSKFLDEWADVVPAERFAAHRATFEGVASAYHTVSYAGIVKGLEPTRRIEHAGGLSNFFSKLDAAARA
ncbi:MAG TPA: aminoglycoside phosphotransferase family protein [Ilumatobacteraceae bacterium]